MAFFKKGTDMCTKYGPGIDAKSNMPVLSTNAADFTVSAPA